MNDLEYTTTCNEAIDELSSQDNPRFGFVSDLEGKEASNKTLQ